MNEVVISLGSNIDPKRNIVEAQQNLSRQFDLVGVSRVYTTKPMDFPHQADFLNGAALIRTDLPYNRLNQNLKRIEKQQGRVKTNNKAGPRTIDLDIIVWNGRIVDSTFYKWDFIKKVVLEVKPDLSDEGGK